MEKQRTQDWTKAVQRTFNDSNFQTTCDIENPKHEEPHSYVDPTVPSWGQILQTPEVESTLAMESGQMKLHTPEQGQPEKTPSEPRRGHQKQTQKGHSSKQQEKGADNRGEDEHHGSPTLYRGFSDGSQKPRDLQGGSSRDSRHGAQAERGRSQWRKAHRMDPEAGKAIQVASEEMLRAKDLRETDRYIVQGSVVGKVINHTLSQRNQEGNERVVEQGGRILKKGETRYTTIEGELLAIMEAVRKHHHHLISKEFIIRSNYINLEYLQGLKDRESGRLHHWSAQLSQYEFTLEQTLYVQKAMIEISSNRADNDTRHQGVNEGLDEKIRRDNTE